MRQHATASACRDRAGRQYSRVPRARGQAAQNGSVIAGQGLLQPHLNQLGCPPDGTGHSPLAQASRFHAYKRLVPRRRKNHDRPGPLQSRRGMLTDRGVPDGLLVRTAQVHATLALASATAMASDFGNRAKADAWREAAGSTMTSWSQLPGASVSSLVCLSQPEQGRAPIPSARTPLRAAISRR